MREQLYACEPTHLKRSLELIANATEVELKLAAQLYPNGLGDDDDEEDDLDDILSVVGDCAHVSITGELSQRGPSPIAKLFGIQGTSYQRIIQALDKADADPNVKSVALDVDSPGGDIMGMGDVWQRVNQLAKPSVAINHGMMASAAYCISSACDEIVATSAACMTGSCGVMIAAIDDSAAEKASGYRSVTIRSKNAPNKNPDISTAQGKDALQELVDAQERVMFSQIAQGRGVSMDIVAQNYGRGAVLVAEDPDPAQPSALTSKMIDRLISLAPLTGPVLAPNSFQGRASSNTRQSPASAGQSQEVTMTLDEFLAQNPDAKAVYDQRQVTAKAEGTKQAQANAARVAKIMAGEAYAKYKPLQAKAVEVLEGKVSFEAFDNLVAMADMMAEANKGSAAGAETGKASETPGQGNTPAPLDAKAIEGLTWAQLQGLDAATMQAIYKDPGLAKAYEAAIAKAGR